jgi:acyl-CoA thioester hydrolase
MVEPLGDAPVSRLVVRVRFCDTDLMGIVHHAKYLEYCEAGRVEFLRRRGLDYGAWLARGLHLPVVEAHLRYRRPSRFDDRLIVDTRVVEHTRVTVRFGYRVLRGPEEELVAEASTLVCCTTDDGAPRRVPADLLALLRGAETHPRPSDQA